MNTTLSTLEKLSIIESKLALYSAISEFSSKLFKNMFNFVKLFQNQVLLKELVYMRLSLVQAYANLVAQRPYCCRPQHNRALLRELFYKLLSL